MGRASRSVGGVTGKIPPMPSVILSQLDSFGPERCRQVDYEEAAQFTRRLALGHTENFTVVSWLLPQRLREDFRNIYAFCRSADDLGDETGDPQRSLELLEWWRRELELCYADRPRHPVYVALQRTIGRHDIPRKPFEDLIDAFVQDQTVTRYDTFDQVLDYCTRSADPVGRLVLYILGFSDKQRQELSDATCTALQLANFWQDVRRDILERDRVYMPRDVAGAHALDLDTMVAAVRADDPGAGSNGCCGTRVPSAGIRAVLPTYRKTVQDLVDRTWRLFETGRGLWPLVPPDVRVDVALFSRGGESILRLVERLDYNTLQTRPTVSRSRKAGLLLQAAVGRMVAGARRQHERN
jgi:squalene synthase HpnC